MTADEFREALDQLGISQVGIARLLGVDDVTARRWAANGTPVPVAILVELLRRGIIGTADIERVHERRPGAITLAAASKARQAGIKRALKARRKAHK
jgi:hypothetical protein